jgi:HNH endonuclease
MKLRAPLKITSRTSSITNNFVQAIIPTFPYSEMQRAEALAKLGIIIQNVSCVYCGSPTTDWDHLRPLVRNSRPTGYISEIRNLVPSCGPCNQSKGAADWKAWMMGKARGSPTTRGVADVTERISCIEEFVSWGNVSPLQFEEMVPNEMWLDYWEQLRAVTNAMRAAQEKAMLVRQHIVWCTNNSLVPHRQSLVVAKPDRAECNRLL